MDFPDRVPVQLWTDKAPLARGNEPFDIPSITAYYPLCWKNTHKAVIILPGGGYWDVCLEHEGRSYAEWLSENGYSAFVVKYRTG